MLASGKTWRERDPEGISSGSPVNRTGLRSVVGNVRHKPTFRYLSAVDERIGDLPLIEICVRTTSGLPTIRTESVAEKRAAQFAQLENKW
jgi:hypothetical protein